MPATSYATERHIPGAARHHPPATPATTTPSAGQPKQLQRALSDIAPETIDEAVAELEAAGVAWRLDDYVGASRCARHLFSLDLIGI